MREIATWVCFGALWLLFTVALPRAGVPWPFLLAGALLGSVLVLSIGFARHHSRPVYRRGRDERSDGGGGGDAGPAWAMGGEGHGGDGHRHGWHGDGHGDGYGDGGGDGGGGDGGGGGGGD